MSSKKKKKQAEKLNNIVESRELVEQEYESLAPKVINPVSSLPVSFDRKKFEQSRQRLNAQDKKNAVSGHISAYLQVCEQLGSVVENLNGLIAKMGSLDKKINNPEIRGLHLSRKLNMNELLLSMKMTAQRLDRDRKKSVMFSNVRKDDILEDVERLELKSTESIFR